MTINYNVTGTDRKALVTAMGEILDVKPKYMGMPTAAYEVDYFTVDKNGAVSFDDRADSEEIENLLEQLAERGFTAEPTEVLEEAEDEDAAEENEPQETTTGLTITVPLDKVAVGTLTTCWTQRAVLLKRFWALTACRLKSVKMKFLSLGAQNCPHRTNAQRIHTSSAPSAK